MRIQTNEMETQVINRGNGGTMKHDWLVENDAARKALHDLYFETGSLPGQQPKAKERESEDSKPAEPTRPEAALQDTANNASANVTTTGFPRQSWIKPAAYLTLVVFLGFGAYRVVPKFGLPSVTPTAHHVKSPLIREALEKRRETSPMPQGATHVAALGSLAVTPTVVMAQYQPGKSTTQTLTIDNQTPASMTFEMEAEDLVAQGQQLTQVPAGDSPNSVAASAVFSRKFVQVGAMDKATVQVSLAWPAATNVRGVVVRFRSTDGSRVGGAGLMAASLGTLITFVEAQDSGARGTESAAGTQASEPQTLTISQWAAQNGTATSSIDDQRTPSNSKGIKVPNLASLGGAQ